MLRYLIAAFIILGVVSCGDSPSRQNYPSAYKEGEIIVKFKTGVRDGQRYSVHNMVSAASVRKIGIGGFDRVKLSPGVSVQQALQTYRANPDVDYAEPNYIVKAVAVPDDAEFNQQWGLHNTGQAVNGVRGSAGADIDAPDAWDIGQGSASVTVAVIDTGIDKNHPDLSGNAVPGYNFVEGNSDTTDLNGHGTHVAGIIGATGNNSVGIAGVDWSVKIMPLRVLDQNGEGTEADVMTAVAYAASNNARVVNMSFAFTPESPSDGKPLKDTIASYPNILFVAAAGNESTNDDITPSYPASFNLSNIVSVAASDQNDNLAGFSNYGPTSVDVAAPGTNILSTIPSFTTGTTYSGAYEVVYLSYGFECISDANTRHLVMQSALNLGNISPGDKILLVDDDGGDTFETYYTEALQSLGFTPDVYAVALNSDGPPLSALSQYKLVIWFTGGEYRNTLTAADQADLASYLDNGGRLFVSGQDIGYDIGSSAFYQNYLHATYVTDDALGSSYTGLNNFSGLFVTFPEICRDSMNDQYLISIDAVNPTGAGSLTAFSINYNDAYQFLNGTSMSTAVVAGIGALIASLQNDFTADQIKETILGSVDILPSLQGRTLTGGRVNAYKALTALLPPSNLNAAAESKTQVLLTWTDNSQGESGFSVERRQSGGQFGEISTVSADQMTYTDSTVQAGKTYTYRVRAFNAGSYSAYSNQTTVTLPGGSNGGGGGGGGCSIGGSRNYQTAVADMVVLFLPAVVVSVIRRLRKIQR
jgi:subtilisin family serine protease